MTNTKVPGSVVLILFLATSASATPPPVLPKPVRRQGPDDPSLKKVREFTWRLDRNVVHDIAIVRAVDIAALKPEELRSRHPQTPAATAPEFALWSKKFDDPELKHSNGYARVVDEKVFTDLRMTRGKDADKLDAAGVVIGRVKLKTYDPETLVGFLVSTGVIDANIHVMATVTGTYFQSDSGDWFALHSDDPYWTNRNNLETYDFGVHIANDGTIRLHHQVDVGRLPAKAAEEKPAEK